MSPAIAHFALGAAMTTLPIAFVVPAVRYPRTLLLAGGGWAMLPDFHWVSPVFTEQLRAVHRTSPWTDLCWLHRTLDRLDPTDSKAVAAAFLAGLILRTAVAERRDYRAAKAIEAAYGSSPAEESSE